MIIQRFNENFDDEPIEQYTVKELFWSLHDKGYKLEWVGQDFIDIQNQRIHKNRYKFQPVSKDDPSAEFYTNHFPIKFFYVWKLDISTLVGRRMSTDVHYHHRYHGDEKPRVYNLVNDIDKVRDVLDELGEIKERLEDVGLTMYISLEKTWIDIFIQNKKEIYTE